MIKIKKKLQIKDFKAMEKLERKYYSDDFITPYSEAYEWYKEYSYSVIAIEAKNRIVGFMNLFPITKKVFAKIEEGTFNDKYLKKADIIDVNKNHQNPVSLFLSCVVIDEDYRKTEALRILLNTYANYYSTCEKKTFDYVITDNVTEDGECFSKNLGFHKVKNSSHESVIYKCSYKDFISRNI